MSKNTGGIFGSRVKPKRKAKGIGIDLNTAPPEEGEEEIRIIFVGESADIDFKGPRWQIEEASNHPAADGMTLEELGNEICPYFDDGTHDMDLKANGKEHRSKLATMVACYLGRHPAFEASKEKGINTFILCGWRKKEGGYVVAMMGCIPEDENPDCYDVLHDVLRQNFSELDKVGFADDSLYFKYRAKLCPVGEELQYLVHSSPRVQEVCDAAKTLFPNCRGLSGEEALDWLRDNASPEEYQDALKRGPENIMLLMMLAKDDVERAELMEKAKQLPGKVELAQSLKNMYH